MLDADGSQQDATSPRVGCGESRVAAPLSSYIDLERCIDPDLLQQLRSSTRLVSNWAFQAAGFSDRPEHRTRSSRREWVRINWAVLAWSYRSTIARRCRQFPGLTS